MHVAKENVPVRLDAPGAIVRLQTGFGDVSGYGAIGAEYFSFDAGTDLTELLHGLKGDSCHSPHWGYIVKGEITTMYDSGETETAREGDLFYWPPGHSVRAEAATDFVMFSPQKEHGEVIDHVSRKVGA